MQHLSCFCCTHTHKRTANKLVRPHSALSSLRRAIFNFRAFQHSGLRQQPTAVLWPQLLRKHAPFSAREASSPSGETHFETHVSHVHIQIFHTPRRHRQRPAPLPLHLAATPRPSSHSSIPALTFKDVCTEAVKDEDEVLLDDHILLLFSPRHNVTATLHSRLSPAPSRSLLRRDGLIQVDGAVSD